MTLCHESSGGLVQLKMVSGIFADTSVLFRRYYEFVLHILKYCSLSRSVANCHHQLLQHHEYAVSRLGPDQNLMPLNCHR